MNIKTLLSIVFLAALVSCGMGSKDASDYEVWGIDLSKHQQSVDWDVLIEKENPNFVFVKATEGLLISDPMYEKFSRSLDEKGVLWGAYHFFGHRTSGKLQALNFIKTAKLKKGNLPPVLDIEHHRFFRGRDKLVEEAKDFCREIRKHYGVYPIIYCSTNYYERYLREAFPENEYVLWIADYTGNHPQTGWAFWQHTDAASLKGVRTKVDRNVFSGDYEELKKLVLR